MIMVTLTFPNGQTQDVLLADVPRKGEHIRLAHCKKSSPSLVVDHVLWMEGDAAEPAPRVFVSVHEHDQ